MKQNYRIIVPALLTLLLAGCNAKYDVIENGIYINEAAPTDRSTQQTLNLTVNSDEETTTTLYLRLAQALDIDINITLALAEEFVDEYNYINDANYVILPDEYYSFTTEVSIPAGSISSEGVNITITGVPQDGYAYCLPLKISSVDADVKIMEKSSRIIYLLSYPLIQMVPTMDYATLPVGSGDWNVSTSEWTLEAWVWMSSFSINNQAIFTGVVSQGTEIYVRFGDANIDYDRLQIKTYGSQFESNTSFSTSTWYHIAYVCGGGKCTLYVNGVEDSSMDMSSTDYVINNLQLCASGSTYFRANCKMAQIRFWSTALSQSALQDAMNRAVPASSEGLIGYWKLDEGDGDVFYDSSSNGRDLSCSVAPTWDTEVDFSSPNS